MTVNEVMSKINISPSYERKPKVDDYLFAINPTPGDDSTEPGDYIVAQGCIIGQTANVTSNTTTQTYLREGENTEVTSLGRSFSINGHRVGGNPFQEAILAVDKLFSTDKNTEYIYILMPTGTGEKGQVSIAVNSDSGGNAGDYSAFDVTFNKTGGNPEEYTYIPPTP